VYREPVTGPGSWEIVNRHPAIPAINIKLATKPTLNLTLTLTLP